MSTVTDVSRTRSIHTLRSGCAEASGACAGAGISYIGFSNFPNQVFRRCIKDGFSFTLMVVGQAGLGKSTFLNTLFMAELHDLNSFDVIDKTPGDILSTVRIEQKTVCLVENDVRLELTVVDTPGFGDQVNNADCWEPIIKFIDNRFEEYLTEETKIDRLSSIPDQRVHLCLYFIAPTGHSLKQLDIAVLRALQDRVNIVPVIAKADTLTPAELDRFKRNIMNDLHKHKVRLYEFPEMDDGQQQTVQPAENGVGVNNAGSIPLFGTQMMNREDKENVKQNGGTSYPQQKPFSSAAGRSVKLPFAVIGSTKLKEVVHTCGVGGERKQQPIRIREYPWGTVEVDNLAHNDFLTLRDMIIRDHLIDLIDVTRNVHYENFRMRNLPNNSFDGDDPFTQLEQQMRQRERELEDDHQQRERVFKEKVAMREQRLMERAQAMDAEEHENRKVLAEKKALLEKLKTEVAELKRGNNLSASSLDSGSVGGQRSNPSSSPEKIHPLEAHQKGNKTKFGRIFGTTSAGGRSNHV